MSLKITFGLCISPDTRKDPVKNQYLKNLVDSILNQPWKKNDTFQVVYADQDSWLPEKKNWIARRAIHEILVIVHDYYLFDSDWLDHFHRFNDENPDWNVCMNRIFTAEKTRHTDWMMSPWWIKTAIGLSPGLKDILMSANPKENGPEFINALPYDCKDFKPYQYISGGYIVCKKNVLLEFPFNEELKPGDPEDVDWSFKSVS